ncbi:MAG: hypothetical protein M3Y82_02205 [Verrucomicrobiota bacterium]|nr:hypothetical protein [Verrucomicrobiota bacterium]
MRKATSESNCNETTYVGNRPLRSLDLLGPDKKTLRQKYLIGEPRSCPLGSAEEMKRRGFVGIYQKSSAVRFRLLNSNLIIEKTW